MMMAKIWLSNAANDNNTKYFNIGFHQQCYRHSVTQHLSTEVFNED